MVPCRYVAVSSAEDDTASRLERMLPGGRQGQARATRSRVGGAVTSENWGFMSPTLSDRDRVNTASNQFIPLEPDGIPDYFGAVTLVVGPAGVVPGGDGGGGDGGTAVPAPPAIALLGALGVTATLREAWRAAGADSVGGPRAPSRSKVDARWGSSNRRLPITPRRATRR